MERSLQLSTLWLGADGIPWARPKTICSGRARRRIPETVRALLLSLVVLAVALLAAPPAAAQPCPYTGCCDLISSTNNPLPGQTVTFILRAGVTTANPFSCPWYGIGATRGTINAGAAAAGLPASTIAAQVSLCACGGVVGGVGSVLTSNLRIQNLDVTRACTFGYAWYICGGCPLNNSAQDVYRYTFAVPAGALPGTVYTFAFTGSVYGINSWAPAGFGVFCPVLSGAIPVGPCGTTLVVGGVPSNDPCSGCSTLTNGVTTPGTTVSATTDGSSSCGGTNDVWYCFTPRCPQPITVSTCGSPSATDTVLSVHTACPGTTANEVVCNDDALPGSACPGSLASSVTFTPVAGQTYYFRVATLGAAGPFQITLNQALAGPPSNDPCAAPLVALNGVTPFTTCGATAVGPNACVNIQHDIWYRYLSTCTGPLTISLCGSSFDTALAVYTGACSNLCLIACNDDNGPQCSGTASSVTFYTGANVPYMIRVGGNAVGQYGSGLLAIFCTSGSPSNDSCGAAPFVGVGTTYGTTLGATPTPGLVGMCGASNGTADVFYRFSTCNAGPVTMTTCGTAPCSSTGAYDTVLSVHSSCPSSTGNFLVVCNDDASFGPCAGTLQSAVTFNPVPCTTYLVRVSGYNGQTGNFALNISQASVAPPNNSCASAITVTSGTTTPFTTCGSTTDGVGTPCFLSNDIWFRWTAPCTGVATIDLCGSSYDTGLAVYPAGVCPPTAGSLITCNDDSGLGSCGFLSSKVTINAVAGSVYMIRVGGFAGQVGCGRLTVTGPGPAAGTCPPTTGGYCPPVLYFAVVGTSTGNPWKWRLSRDCCFNVENCNVPGVLPVGSPPAALAAAFVASINAACPPPGSAILATDLGGGAFQVKARCCPGNTNPTKLSVGTVTDACNALCVVTTGILSTSGPCSFNPNIIELETSGLDCNNNGIDDLVDIALGTSIDANSDGIPDECFCQVDINGDGAVNVADYLAFLSIYSTGGDQADFNRDGQVNVTDYLAFLSAYSAGCP
jgi:hypothetical protein